MIAGIAGDPDATRTVYGVVIALAAIGVLLICTAVWLFRQTRVDPELLAPLERMDDRKWNARDPATQRRMLDEVRPTGAEPLHRERAVPAVDEEFEREPAPVTGFDDLRNAELATLFAAIDDDAAESSDEEPAGEDGEGEGAGAAAGGDADRADTPQGIDEELPTTAAEDDAAGPEIEGGTGPDDAAATDEDPGTDERGIDGSAVDGAADPVAASDVPTADDGAAESVADDVATDRVEVLEAGVVDPERAADDANGSIDAGGTETADDVGDDPAKEPEDRSAAVAAQD